MRELQGIQAYAVVSKQMMLKEGQVFKRKRNKDKGADLMKKKQGKDPVKSKEKKVIRSQQQGDLMRPKRERMLLPSK